MPIWLSWVIYIGTLVMCFVLGWIIRDRRADAALIIEQQKYLQKLKELRAEGDRRRDELVHIIDELHQHMDVCHKQTGTNHDRS